MTQTPTPTIRRLSHKGPMHDLLLKACPPSKKGVQSIPTLAKLLKISPYAIYRWIDKNRIPPERAEQIVKLAPAHAGVTLDEFFPYIFGRSN